MRKTVITLNILAFIPALILVPLSPFAFILIYNEGTIPGMFHERLLQTLMVLYPLGLLAMVIMSIRLVKRQMHVPAIVISIIPSIMSTAIVLVYLFGGIQLR